jgi:hypothetical protein
VRVSILLLAGLLALAHGARAQETDAAPSPGESAAPPRVFVLHKDLPRQEKGGRVPALIGREPIYAPGESVRFGAYRPGGDDAIIESVEVKISTPYTASVGFTIPLTESNSGSSTYVGSIPVDARLTVPGPTRDRGLALLLADPSPAGAEIGRLVVQSVPGLPREDLGQLRPYDTSAEFAPPARMWFELGGSEPATISYGSLRGRFVVGRCANWIWVSGRYSPQGGLVSLGDLSPADVSGAAWRESLQLLVFATGWAADVNDVCGRAPVSPMRGLHGQEWWRKFQRTLAGYTGPAPASEEEGAIAGRFVKLARDGPGGDSELPQSRHFVGAWLRANQAQLVTGAVAIDASGAYHHQPPARALTLRGVPFTLPSLDPWIATPRAEWEVRSGELRNEALYLSWTDYLLNQLCSQRGGQPPSAAEWLTEQVVDWILEASKHPKTNDTARQRVRAGMARRHRMAEDVYRTFSQIGAPK